MNARVSPSLRWYYRNRKEVLARAALRAKRPGFNEKRREYKAALRRRLISLGLLVERGPGRPKKVSDEAVEKSVVVSPAV